MAEWFKAPVLKPFPWHPLPCKRVSLHPTTSALSRSHSFTRPTPYHSMLSGRVANRVARATCGKHSTEWRNAKSISTSVASSAANPDHCGRVSTERVGLLRSAPREPSSSCGYRHTASLLFFPVSGSLAVQEINIVYALAALAISAVFSSFAVMAGRPAALRRHKVTGRLASTAGTMRCGSQPHRRELCSGVVKSTAPFLG